MPVVSVGFQFRQRFEFPVGEVYKWATDYEPQDIQRMGLRGRRKIERLADDALLVIDAFRADDGTLVRKQKLVRLYPQRLFWTNTHLAGPNRGSQFLYQLTPVGKRACRLEFTGRQISQQRSGGKKTAAALARKLKREDAQIWKNLARAMKAERRAAAAR